MCLHCWVPTQGHYLGSYDYDLRLFSSKDEEILPFPWAAATWFCFGIELHILGEERKMIWILLEHRGVQSHRRALGATEPQSAG